MSDDQNSAGPDRAAAELEKAQAEATRATAEARRAVVEARRAEAAGGLPAPTTKPLEGTITAGEGFGFLAGVVAHESVARAATRVATNIRSTLGQASDERVLLATETDRTPGDLVLIQVEGQVQRMAAELTAQIKATERVRSGEFVAPRMQIAGVGAVLAGASSLAGLTADLIGFFRTNYSVKGWASSASDFEARATVAGVLAEHDIEVHVEGMSPITSSSVTDRFSEVVGQIAHLRRSVAALKQTLSTDEPDDSPKQLVIAEASAAIDSCISLLKDLTTAPQNGAAPLAIAAARRALLDGHFTRVAHVSVAATGGDAITMRRVLGSPQVAFLGGGVVTYLVQDARGSVLKGGVESMIGRLQHDLKSAHPEAITFSST